MGRDCIEVSGDKEKSSAPPHYSLCPFNYLYATDNNFPWSGKLINDGKKCARWPSSKLEYTPA